NLGNALAMLGKLDGAIAAHRKAIELDPKNALAHNNLGKALYDQKKPAEAIACYRKAVELDPKNARFHYDLGNALNVQGKLDEAIACLRKAIALDPKHAQAHNNLAWILVTCPDLKLRNPAEAVRVVETGLQVAPQDGGMWKTLGVAQYRAGNCQGTLE